MAARTDQIDPLFAALAYEIYGDDVDIRELWAVSKGMPDASSTHAPSAKSDNRKRKALVGGLLLGTAAEAAGTARAARNFVGEKPPLFPKLAAVTGSKGGKAAELGLQAVNFGVGLAAAHHLIKEKKPGSSVSKNIRPKIVRIPHSSPEELVRANARTRRIGLRLVGATGLGASAGGGYAVGQRTRSPRVTPSTQGAVKKDVGISGSIVKMDADKRQIFGWANLAIVDGEQVVDLQGDYVPIDEIEKSAYSYMLNSRKGGHMHQRIGKGLDGGPVHVADIIESVVFTPEKLEALGLEPDALPLGWWTGMQVHDEDVWQRVKRGELTGLSIHGTGTRTDMVYA